MAGLPMPFFYISSYHVICPTTPDRSGLGSSAFAHRYLRNRVFFLFLQVLRCFTSLSSPHLIGNSGSHYWVAPFGYPRLYRLLTAYRGFSQFAASFFACHRLGILYAPLVAWPNFAVLYILLSLNTYSTVKHLHSYIYLNHIRNIFS